jgi:ubiquinone/menaquinone biosynthesis C-methylase UbiE
MGATLSVGIDFSPAMTRLAKAAHGLCGVADMRRLPFAPRTWDVVIHALALGHVARPAAALAECARVLVPGGVLALVDVHPAAARRGWRRTFRDESGRLLSVAWSAPPIEDVLVACASSGLAVERWEEVSLSARDLPAGAPRRARGPAVFALRARRV